MLARQKNKLNNWMCAGALVAVSLILFCSGCQRLGTMPVFGKRVATEQFIPPPTYQTYVSPTYRSRRPSRILMIESGPSYGNYGESKKLIAELATQIRATGAFEIVTSDIQLHSSPDNILHGKFDEREIAVLSRMHRSDAVALVRVNELQTHNSLRTSVTMAVIDSDETVVTFGIDGAWDTANSATKAQFESFVAERTGAKVASVHYQSPTQLFAFVASQVANELQYAR